MQAPEHVQGLPLLNLPYNPSIPKLRGHLENVTKDPIIIDCALFLFKMEIDRLIAGHNDYLKVLFESHNKEISDVKRKQWCANCEQKAIYPCCWNTSYCSYMCQYQHWIAGHEEACLRGRILTYITSNAEISP